MCNTEKILSPDQLAAHCLLSELRTRISLQPLPYQYGVETTALESLWALFGLAREIMKEYPNSQEFSRLTANVLNVEVRPVTAKWHRALKMGLLDSKDGANDFRIDLALLQVKLVEFSRQLQLMAYGVYIPDEISPNVIGEVELGFCFESIEFGLEKSAASSVKNADEINQAEAAEIAGRRDFYDLKIPKNMDAVGMALSGGGIRSATFCMGAVQVLAERGLMKDIDYLSTVSGGGYLGSLITAVIGGGKGFEEIGKPFGPDSDSIRHVRQNAKYLSVNGFVKRWLTMVSLIAGLILNWTTPLFFISLFAILSNYVAPHLSVEIWRHAANILGLITAVFIVVYGVSLRFFTDARILLQSVAWGAAFALLALAIFAVERGYSFFMDVISTHWSISWYMAASIIVLLSSVQFLPIVQISTSKKIVSMGLTSAISLLIPLIALASFYYLRILGSHQMELDFSPWEKFHYVDGSKILLLIAATSGITTFFLNVNQTGLHKLYRDQLSNTFLPNTEKGTSQKLSAMNPEHRAPYHLINATINLPSSDNRVLRDRMCDFFIFSKHWSGASSIGYEPTKEWKSNGQEIDLATAMAISGAAAAPQMGKKSRPSFFALLTLLNVRLGYWIASPEKKTKATPGFLCLLREMTGIGMNEKSTWLNLSDGGHIENMGVYELLKRRCKFIICVDGEADPKLTFEGQLSMVRHAQIDLGIRLEPKLDDIRLDPKSNYSRTHCHFLRIHYPEAGPNRPSAIGLMLYLKLSLTGDEEEILKRYRAVNPEFPHQPTTDQFYDEEQFEVYRQLGVHVAEGMFSPALLTQDVNPKTVESWFRQLARNMLEPTR